MLRSVSDLGQHSIVPGEMASSFRFVAVKAPIWRHGAGKR
jgi:hypothetical protein